MSLEGKVALITGGGTGIGAACARRFMREGAQVAVMGRRKNLLEEVAAETGAMAIAGDAANAGDVRAAVAMLTDTWGGLDIVVANAGASTIGAVLETDDAAWEEGLRTNLTTAFVTVREALPSLIERKGNIVIIASIGGLVAATDVCVYTAAKHALIGLMRSLARDYGPKGVRVNAVCPAWVRTPMADGDLRVLVEREGISLDAAYAMVTRDVPLRRPAAADEIAAVCHFLASHEASIVTGAVITADGGSTIVDVPTLTLS